MIKDYTYNWNLNQRLLTQYLKKEATFYQGIEVCLEMHTQVHDLATHKENPTIFQELLHTLNEEAYRFRPQDTFASIIWNIWHITRIEDAITNILLSNNAQVLTQTWQECMNVTIADTGNAYTKKDVDELDTAMNVKELLKYRKAVGKRTQKVVGQIQSIDRNKKPTEEQLARIVSEGVLVPHKESIWLLEYWRKKTIVGLLLMPITRHQIVHINDCFKLRDRYMRACG